MCASKWYLLLMWKWCACCFRHTTLKMAKAVFVLRWTLYLSKQTSVVHKIVQSNRLYRVVPSQSMPVQTPLRVAQVPPVPPGDCSPKHERTLWSRHIVWRSLHHSALPGRLLVHIILAGKISIKKNNTMLDPWHAPNCNYFMLCHVAVTVPGSKRYRIS